jgi:SAM-dependent MidA family methyltransferase
VDLRALIIERIRRDGALTVAAYMDLALYAPGLGYYARAARRSGRTGDFFTSVDLGPMFGELLAASFAEMATAAGPPGPDASWDLVEAGAGNGRLSRDVLAALQRHHPDLYACASLTLVECSPAARAVHPDTLGSHAARLRESRADLPDNVCGVIFANELLDAMPVHVVTMTPGGLAEVYVDLAGDALVERLGPPSSPDIPAYFQALGLSLEPGARAEVHLAGVAWIRQAAEALERGYLVIIDYGFDAAQLYAPSAPPTLRTFHQHLADAPGGETSCRPQPPPYLVEPGERDLTTHVDFTSVRQAAEAKGLVTVEWTNQARFLLAAAERSDLLDTLASPERLADRLALKTLLMPEGMGTAFRVLVMARHAPPLPTRHAGAYSGPWIPAGDLRT